jgi:chorismate lyase/3-hydroxybenzoate synthase
LSGVASSPSRSAAEHRLVPPAWVGELLGPGARWSTGLVTAGEGFSLEVLRGEGFCLATLAVRGARSLDRPTFQDVTGRAYRRLEAELRSRGTVHPVRLWNHIPGIHEPMGPGLDRYRVFNAGRYEALVAWFGGKETFDTRVASASGVGHDGHDLIIHGLAAEQPGRAVGNPRQVAPYRYSRKYGPLPPCFARATVIQTPAGPSRMLVGGTASIVGEESVHLADLRRQTEETLTNLAVLIPAAAGEPEGAAARRSRWLSRYREVRVYYPDPARLGELRHLLQGAFPGAARIEWVRADLCRPELMVEIEGVADVA